MSQLFDFYMLLAFRAWQRSQPEIAEDYMTLAYECLPGEAIGYRAKL